MKKVMVALIVVLELLYILSGCSGSSAESSSSATAESVYVHMSESVPSETNRTAAVCMGSVSHPVHRIVQLGFMEKLEFISNGSVDACISNPGYEEGYVGMEILDNLLGGRLYNISEEHWRQELPGPLVYSGGIGKENPAYHDELFHRVKTRFVVSETNA